MRLELVFSLKNPELPIDKKRIWFFFLRNFLSQAGGGSFIKKILLVFSVPSFLKKRRGKKERGGCTPCGGGRGPFRAWAPPLRTGSRFL